MKKNLISTIVLVSAGSLFLSSCKLGNSGSKLARSSSVHNSELFRRL